jgi:hypothetical protein
MAFGFRIRFLAPSGVSLDSENGEVRIQLSGAPEPLVLRQRPPRPDALPSDPVVFTLDGNGFFSEAEARSFGSALKYSLAVYSVRHRWGFNMGHDRIASSVGRVVREDFEREFGIRIRPVVHGLDVFELSKPVRRLEMHGRGSVHRIIRDLPSDLAKEFPQRLLPPKLAMAIELYNACPYDTDSEVRFLSLVTVIEALATRTQRSESALKFIADCHCFLQQSNLSDDERKALKNGLGNLKTESIRAACLRLVSSANSDTKFFGRCYTARSELLHDGVVSTYPEIIAETHLLDDIVRSVVLHKVDSTSP